MSADGLLRRLLLVLFLLSAVQAALNAAELPALSAAWFDRTGEALHYLETWRLMWVHVGIAAAIAAAFWVLPTRLVPHAEPARRPDPRAAALRRWHWLGILTLLALTALAQLVYDANRTAIPRLPLRSVLLLLGSYAAFVATWALVYARSRRAAAATPRADERPRR